MSKFPQLGKTDKSVVDLINKRARSNTETSKMVAWMRIASALNIEGMDGNGMILESTPKDATFSTTYGDTTKSGRIGVDFTGKSIYAKLDRSFRPSPTIESLSLTNNARGLSRKASFSITCYTLAQAEALSPYFMEPGYTVLIEYGWNGSGTIPAEDSSSKKTYNSLEHKAVLNPEEGACSIAAYNNWAHVLSKREESAGTYDGFMGFITGGGMKTGENETWILDVEVTTIGEIPAYLQQNKTGGQKVNDTNVTGLTFDISQLESSDSDENIGMKYFQMMYNRLPAGKRTALLKKLATKPDIHGNPFSHRGNFVNMEPKLAEVINEGLSNEIIKKDKQEKDKEIKWIRIPSGAEIFTDQSFIRLELAFAIINSYIVDIKSTKSTCTGPKTGPGLETMSYVIETNHTIVRAHKHIFPTDSSILFIPNINLPDFGLKDALAASTESESEFIKLGDDGMPKETVNACPFKFPPNESDNQNFYAFPSPLDYGDDKVTKPPVIKDKRVNKVTSLANDWGYLRNLYINLDFFIGTLDKSSYVTKDCYYDILNGISSAVNGYWNFQIHTTIVPNKAGKEYVNATAVSDLSFAGVVPTNIVNDIIPFKMHGIDSPFITSNITFDIPAAMQNSILGQRNSGEAKNITTTTDGEKVVVRGLFTTEEDPVMKILNRFELAELDGEKKESSEIHKANFDLFMGNVTVIPFTENDAVALDKAELDFWIFSYKTTKIKDLDKLVMAMSWNDVSLLSKFERGPITSGAADKPMKLSQNPMYAYFIEQMVIPTEPVGIINPMLLPITFEFEIHGTSGLQLGDMIKVSDLPKKYEKTILQIKEINHQLSDMLWTTSVKAEMRNTG